MKSFTKLDRTLQGLEAALDSGVLPTLGAKEVRGNIRKLRDWAAQHALTGTDIEDWIMSSPDGKGWDREESPRCWCAWLERTACMGAAVCREILAGRPEGAIQRAYEQELAPHLDMATRALFWGIARVANPLPPQEASRALARCSAAAGCLTAVLKKQQ